MLFTPRPKSLNRDSFIKLSDGQEIAGVFRGTPYTFRRHWIANRSSECTGDGCASCAADPENFPAYRFRINFITTVDGKYVPKIFEGGGGTYDELVALDKKFGLASTPVEIVRRGSGQQTRYTFLPMANMPLTPAMVKQLDAVQLLPLNANDAAE